MIIYLKNNLHRNKKGVDSGGFTLIEIVVVISMIGILSIFAIVKYTALQEEARLQVARNIVAAAQSQLSLVFSLLAISGQSFDRETQATCEAVIVSSSTASATILCTGKFNDKVSITVTLGDQTASGHWISPVMDDS